MIAKVLLVFSLALSIATAIPIDAYGHSGLSYHAPAISYAAPAISYAAPKILAAPAITTSVVHHAPAAYAAPAITYAHAAPTYVSAPAPALIAHAAPTIIKAAPAVAIAKVAAPEPYDPNPQYSFSYGVTDHHTGDSKSAEESLVNGVVHGFYSLTEPDGSIRKVTYTADKINGFNAVVEKKGGPVAVVAKPAIAVPVAKVAYAAPAIASYGHSNYH